MKYKNICHLDLESTCYEKGKEPMNFFSEIIEIGFVIINPNTMETLDKFEILIRPVLFPKLSNFCINLTTIEQKEVANAMYIREAFKEIEKKFNLKDTAFSSWGKYDNKRIIENSKKFNINNPFPKNHINLKNEHANFYKIMPKGNKEKNTTPIKYHEFGTRGALSYHKLSFNGTQHRALPDAKNTAEVLKIMIKDGWEHPFMTV
jgi:3'-5' exoribonuclease 1